MPDFETRLAQVKAFELKKREEALDKYKVRIEELKKESIKSGKPLTETSLFQLFCLEKFYEIEQKLSIVADQANRAIPSQMGNRRG